MNNVNLFPLLFPGYQQGRTGESASSLLWDIGIRLLALVVGLVIGVGLAIGQMLL